MKRRQMSRMWIIGVAVLLLACGKELPKNEASASTISGFNYSSEGIQEYYVNGAWGGGHQHWRWLWHGVLCEPA